MNSVSIMRSAEEDGVSKSPTQEPIIIKNEHGDHKRMAEHMIHTFDEIDRHHEDYLYSEPFRRIFKILIYLLNEAHRIGWDVHKRDVAQREEIAELRKDLINLRIEVRNTQSETRFR